MLDDVSAPLVFAGGDGAVRVWFANLDRDRRERDLLARHLSEEEVERAGRFRLSVHRDRFVVRRGLLRSLLGATLGIRPDRVRFTYGAAGKPALAAELGDRTLRFNASHSGSLAAFAVSLGRDVGIDVAEALPDRADPAVAERYFSASENETLRRIPRPRWVEAFYSCWTRKEAFVKARGEGLALPLDAFDVELRPERAPSILRTCGDPGEADRWQVFALEPREGYVGALVTHANRGE